MSTNEMLIICQQMNFIFILLNVLIIHYPNHSYVLLKINKYFLFVIFHVIAYKVKVGSRKRLCFLKISKYCLFAIFHVNAYKLEAYVFLKLIIRGGKL